MEDKRQIYKEAYKKIDELEKEIDSLKKEKERLEVNTTDELEKLRGRFFLIDGNMKYLLISLVIFHKVFQHCISRKKMARRKLVFSAIYKSNLRYTGRKCN